MAASDPALYAFELTFKTLNDSKTPVSRSKIQKITELAVKAQKFYKHVVMNVESFIKKWYVFSVVLFTPIISDHAQNFSCFILFSFDFSSPKHKLPGKLYMFGVRILLSRETLTQSVQILQNHEDNIFDCRYLCHRFHPPGFTEARKRKRYWISCCGNTFLVRIFLIYSMGRRQMTRVG